MSRVLAVPDIHQNLHFITEVLGREDLARFDRVILLGDYFDARHALFDSDKAVVMIAQLVQQLCETYPRKIRLMWGNHDLPYCRLREYVNRVGAAGIEEAAGDNEELFKQLNTARLINEVWSGVFWSRLRMAELCDGILYSHAGIHAHFWPEASTPERALSRLSGEFDDVVADLFENEQHPLLDAGPARGGTALVGGPLWQDWNEEFEDSLPFAQIIGHNSGPEPRNKGRSWCIDTAGHHYAIVEEGEVVLRSIDG